ncbi:MAG: S8 family serine peptidase [Thermodesulfobacteriota bacterium]
MRIAVIDTGVNPWHSHVRGRVEGCRVRVGADGSIREDGDFRDPVGHGTAVAGVLREALPEAELFAVRVFGDDAATYPSLVARGILLAAAEGCRVLNLSLGVAPGPGAALLAQACEAAAEAGCVLVAPALPNRPDGAELLPAALPGVCRALADDGLSPGEVLPAPGAPRTWRAAGRPRDLPGLPPGANLWGSSFACARVAAHLARAQLTRTCRAAG